MQAELSLATRASSVLDPLDSQKQQVMIFLNSHFASLPAGVEFDRRD